MESTTLIDMVVVCGIVVVLPLALGRAGRWLLAAAAATLSVLVPTGVGSAALASVWLVVAVAGLVGATHRTAVQTDRGIDQVVELGTASFAVVAAAAFLASHGGIALFGTGEPIVELTSVHFTYAGVGALTLAGATSHQRPTRRTAAVVMTAAAPPIVAAGFMLQHPVPQVGGAILMSSGVLVTAALQLCEAWTRTMPRWPLLLVSGAAPWVPMGLAIGWASSLYWNVPALSIPDMVRTHGMLNVVFVVAGLVGRRTEIRAGRASASALSHDPAATR